MKEIKNLEDDLKKIPTEKLIKELDSRDILTELGDKGLWLKEKGYQQVPFNFINFQDNPINVFYSFKYVFSHSLDDIKGKRENLREIIGNS